VKNHVCVVFVIILSIQLDSVSARAQTADSRPDDQLLAWVGQRQLRDSEFRCVRQIVDAWKFEFRDVSSWVLQRLQQRQATLRRCGPADSFDSSEELLLGPVVWQEPSRQATVYFGFDVGILGREAYYVRRGRFGRWHFGIMIRE
jgi:hypothetical protein